jgi:microcystin-dependent protein
MTSNLRTLATYSKHQLPTTGDTKTSANGADHEGWLLCDGRSLDIYEYNILYNTIGRSFGNGSGAAGTTFSLPNPKGRVPGVTGAGPGLTTRRLGDLVGQETVTLVEAQLPS